MMPATTPESVIVVGRGLIGSAAARHLAEAGAKTTLIGPIEPDVYADGPVASHWDEGRVTRIASLDDTWAEVAARSIDRYAEIERRSGIEFHAGCGLVWLGDGAALAAEQANRRGGSASVETTSWLRDETGIVAADPSTAVCMERSPAGRINPRALVRAQVGLAEAAGATIIDGAATAVARTARGIRASGTFGSADADHLILATGPHAAELVGVSLSVERRLRTVVLAELGPAPGLPSLIADDPGVDELDEIYWVPPVPFPDGRTMLKIGGDMIDLQTAETSSDLEAWFRSGGSEREAAALEQSLRQHLPFAEITHVEHRPCVTTFTPGGWPFIGPIDDRVSVALGGSGAAAKSSDELGRLATQSVIGDWTDPTLDLDVFAPKVVRRTYG
ncbi:MAG: NAD(P)/FAD-dependent oxidoreductase [Acidimicrobiales bacterium]